MASAYVLIQVYACGQWGYRSPLRGQVLGAWLLVAVAMRLARARELEASEAGEGSLSSVFVCFLLMLLGVYVQKISDGLHEASVGSGSGSSQHVGFSDGAFTSVRFHNMSRIREHS